MRLSLCLRSIVPLLLLMEHAALAQAPADRSAAKAFRGARHLYYTPVDKGLQGFQCDVVFDWKQFIEKANSAPVSEMDQRLLYLQGIKLSVHDDLNGTGALDWVAPTTAPDASEASISQIRTGLQALWSGFFQSWNGFYTGDLVSLTENNTTVERTPAGYHVFTRQGAKLAEQQYSNDFTLQSMHVATPEIDSMLLPVFESTRQGRLVTGLNSVVKRPPADAGTSVNTTVTYAEVNGFQLPSTVLITVSGATDFRFTLANCTVRTQLTSAPAASAPHTNEPRP